jgi:hypothetical protein
MSLEYPRGDFAGEFPEHYVLVMFDKELLNSDRVISDHYIQL